MIKFTTANERNMSNGMRDLSRTLLTDEEIEFVKSEIRRIGADERVFAFNVPTYINKSTCYNYYDDIVYVTRNVFPDVQYGSVHPRDLMSVGAVLAHEYYGHRPNRQEYIQDREISIGLGEAFHTTPLWQDECRASTNAAKLAPNLTNQDKSYLIMDAVYRAQEKGQLIQIDDFMKEVLYGYPKAPRNITPVITSIKFVSATGKDGAGIEGRSEDGVPEVSRKINYYNDYER